MASKLRDKILNAKDRTQERLYIPEWDAEIEVWSLTGEERALLMQSSIKASGTVNLVNMYGMMAVLSTHDPEDGSLVFEDTDRGAVMQKNGAIIERIAQISMRLSGLTDEALKEAEKNSPSIQSDGSTLK